MKRSSQGFTPSEKVHPVRNSFLTGWPLPYRAGRALKPPQTAAERILDSVRGFTILELIMTLVIVGILAATALPKFINMRVAAINAKAEGNIAALRSAISIYYAKTALSTYEGLCTAAGNPYRSVDAPSPCYPADYEELESLLTNPPDWSGGSGACYDSSSGAVIPCP